MMLRAALAYASRLGWPVFPCRPCGKEPLTPHGVHDATTNPAVIRAWWERWPQANVALAAGSEFVVVDVDPRNGGSESILDIESAHEPFPRTVTAQTGGAGWHYLYRAPVGTRVRGSIAPGVDMKGHGGYIVAAPSTHPSGRPYRWHPDLHPLRVELTPAPEWLLALATVRPAVDHGPAIGAAAQSFLARAFDVAGWLGHDLPNGAVTVRCPWEHEHSDGRGDGSDSSTVILPPTSARPLGTFRCSHGHCATRGTIAALEALPEMAIVLAGNGDPAGLDLACSLLRKGAAA